TTKGVYQGPIDDIDGAVKVLDTKQVLRLRRFDDEVFAATRSGLFRLADRGTTWTSLDVPRQEVYSVFLDTQNNKLYAGTHPAHLYVSEDHGKSWHELTGLQDLPSRDSWKLPRHRNEAHIRSICAHPDAPQRIIVGIEVGGVHVSEDGGKAWTERRDGLHDDIHHVLIVGAAEYVASTGGLYRTRDAGRSWTRLDKNVDHSYFREAFVSGGKLYAAAARSAPPSWQGQRGADAAPFESTDGGGHFTAISYPGQPADFVLAWAAPTKDAEHVIAGTRGGRILRRVSDGWSQIGSIPSSIRSLTVV